MKHLSLNSTPIRSSKQLGHLLKEVRMNSKISQDQLSQLSGLRQAGVSLIESGSNGIRLGSLFKMLTALNLEIIIRPRPQHPSDSHE